MHWKDTKDNEIYLKKRFFYTNLSFILNTYIDKYLMYIRI